MTPISGKQLEMLHSNNRSPRAVAIKTPNLWKKSQNKLIVDNF